MERWRDDDDAIVWQWRWCYYAMVRCRDNAMTIVQWRFLSCYRTTLIALSYYRLFAHVLSGRKWLLWFTNHQSSNLHACVKYNYNVFWLDFEINATGTESLECMEYFPFSLVWVTAFIRLIPEHFKKGVSKAFLSYRVKIEINNSEKEIKSSVEDGRH